MAIHKCIFVIKNERISAFRFKGKDCYEPVKYKGESAYIGGDIHKFFDWFHDIESIASDDKVDFCLLATAPLDFAPDIAQYEKHSSSWTKKEITEFCSSNLNYSNYEIVINENTRIVNQVSNVYDDAVFSKLYMKCFPEYSGGNESITSDVTDEETSMLSWYFMKKLKEL